MKCHRSKASLLGLCLSLAAGVSLLGVGQPAEEQAPPQDPAYVLHHKANLIDGTACKLEQYKGKVVLIVNVASRCGLTPQYDQLEELYRLKKDEGLVVLGFPANNFAGQEPGSNEEIATFCREEYDVTFPMFEKISVLGEDRHPLYKQLAELPAPIGGDPEWNFAKYLVDRNGVVTRRVPSRTKPNDEGFRETLDSMLAAEPSD